MISLNEGFNWDIFNKNRIDELGLKSTFASVYNGNGYCSKPIFDSETQKRKTPSYKLWMRMIRNCFANDETLEKAGEKRGTVCDEWRDYAIFKEWYDKNYYQLNGERVTFTRTCFNEHNTHYSPETCVFAPLKIIKALKTYGDEDKMLGINGEVLPKGIYYNEDYNYYDAWAMYNGEKIEIGTGDDILELHYLVRKIQMAELNRMAETYKGKIPNRLYERMKEYDYDMGEIRIMERNTEVYRAYCKMLRLMKRKNYSLCKEWKDKDNFEKWFQDNKITGIEEEIYFVCELLENQNKILSPDTCCFLPKTIFLALRENFNNSNRDLPQGVSFITSRKDENMGKYSVHFSCKKLNIKTNVGVADTLEEAKMLYKEIKEQCICLLADIYKDVLDEKVYVYLKKYEYEEKENGKIE